MDLQMNKAEIYIYGGTKPTFLDSNGNGALTQKQYKSLTPEQKNDLSKKVKGEKLKRIMQIILKRGQIGDMFYKETYTNQYVIVGEPSQHTECVIAAPCITIELPNEVDAYVYLIPNVCTNYLIKHNIVPLASKTPLNIPIVDKFASTIEITNIKKLSHEYDDHVAHPLYKYIEYMCAHNKNTMFPSEIVEDNRAYYLNLYQHPTDQNTFFDIFGTVFKVTPISSFKKALPSKIEGLRSRSASAWL